MSTASDTSRVKRRKPERPRGAQRVAELLAAAADVIAEVGYEAATMTAISERAGASVGTVYQYYPNKDAIVRALRAQFSTELRERWEALATGPAAARVDTFAEGILDSLVEFLARRPAFVALLGVPPTYRDPVLRHRLREPMAAAFRRFRPALTEAEAFRIAHVTIKLVGALQPAFGDADAKERAAILGEFKLAVKSYLVARLG